MKPPSLADLLTEDEVHELENELLADPEVGQVIMGTPRTGKRKGPASKAGPVVKAGSARKDAA